MKQVELCGCDLKPENKRWTKRTFCKSNYEYNESDALSKLALGRKRIVVCCLKPKFYEQHIFQKNIVHANAPLKVLFCTSKEIVESLN